MKTKTEILRIIIDGFEKQKTFGFTKNDGKFGWFVNPVNGNKCALGMLISDHLYSVEMEPSHPNFSSNSVSNLVVEYIYSTYIDDKEFLSELEDIHDSAIKHNCSFEYMMDQYRGLLSEY